MFTVSEVEERTGVPASSLRQWERRYGFPDPERSASGYRYYSEHDVLGITRMRDLVADGVPPSRAAAMLKSESTVSAQARSAAALAQELGKALQQYDAEQADQIYSEALSLYPVDSVVLDVIRPTLIRIGDLWHGGHITVAAEHFASNFLQGRLRSIFRVAGGASHGARIVVACAPGEQHEMGGLMVAIMLRRAGFQVVYLGADMPLEDLVTLVHSGRFAAVLLSATTPDSVVRLRAGQQALRSLPCPLVFGGSLFEADEALAGDLGGAFLGNDVHQAVKQLEQLLGQ